MLKPYFERGSTSDGSHSSLAVPVSDPSLSTDGVVLMSALVEGIDEVESSPSHAVIEGRLNNTAMLSVLADHLPHLAASERADILKMVHQFPKLFGDVPRQTPIIEHDIDVGDSVPIKQHPYRVNPVKRAVLKK